MNRFVLLILLLGGCSSNGDLQQVLIEKNRVETERDELKQQLNNLKEDWAAIQNENSSAKLIQDLRDELRNVIIKQLTSGFIYPDHNNVHWIKEVVPLSGIIVLDDGSVWAINPVDRAKTALWLPISKVSILKNDKSMFPYFLVNMGNGKKAEAKFISQQL